jgi:hypothetical protein
MTNGGLHLVFQNVRLSELLGNISKKKVSFVEDD